MDTRINKSLFVSRSDIRTISLHEMPIRDLKEGEILILVDSFALTANNISYAAIGEMLQYWNFFPTGKEGKGIVPVWGYAEVVESKNQSIRIGQTLYGYLPMSDYFIAQPGKISRHGFRDMADHRQQNAVIYNNYEFVDPKSTKDLFGQYAPLIRPLFTTSFLLYYFFADASFNGAEQIILTSASSKTALALASMLKSHPTPENLSVIGLTSNSNKAFVEGTGLYHNTITYDAIATLPNRTTVIADFAGNRELLQNIDHNLNNQLIHIASIGLTDWESNTSKIRLPKAKMFFAPTYAEIKLKEWGPAKGMSKIKTAMDQFISEASKWIRISQHNGLEQGMKMYKEMVAGTVDPKEGIMIKVH